MVFGGGKCPNLGVANVQILRVVNVLLANDSQSLKRGQGPNRDFNRLVEGCAPNIWDELNFMWFCGFSE